MRLYDDVLGDFSMFTMKKKMLKAKIKEVLPVVSHGQNVLCLKFIIKLLVSHDNK